MCIIIMAAPRESGKGGMGGGAVGVAGLATFLIRRV